MKIHPSFFLVTLGMANIFLTTGLFLGATESDDRITAAAQSSHVFKIYLKDDAVKIQSREGAVTLSGTVAEAFHKSMAQDVVECLPGVKRVDNQIKITGEKPPENSDKRLVVKVRTALIFNPKIDGMGTEVTAENGVVRLGGGASSAEQKELVGEYVRDVEGVRSVKNEMTVAPARLQPAPAMTGKIDDASITAQIKASLLVHRSSSAGKTRVQTQDGLVTLSGAAANATEKYLITKLVNEVQGVSIVINTMTIGVTSASAN